MTSFVTPFYVQNILRDLRNIVVDLNKDVKRHIPGQDFEKEHKKNRSRQLRDLENENRQLRQLYEDSQWTLYLVMESHRRILEANFGRDNDFAILRKRKEIDENVEQNFCANAVQITKEINDFFEREEKIGFLARKRMGNLRAENNLLRNILDLKSGVNIHTVAELSKRTPDPLKFTHGDSESCSERKDLLVHGKQSAPRKKSSVIRCPSLN